MRGKIPFDPHIIIYINNKEEKSMKKNDIFELEITDMGTDGEGIGHYDGMTFFVKDALIGDVITARATKLKKNYGYARVEEIKTPSTFRVEPQCELHKRCGGCQIQALSYEKQLEFKNNKVRNNLMRIGGFSEAKLDSKMQPPVGADNPYRYRNKAQFPVGYDRDGNIVTGFYASRSHNIIPVEDCRLGVPQNKEILDIIKEWMNECGITSYDENTHKGLVRHVLIRYGFTSKQIMVCLVINGDSLEAKRRAGNVADILCERLSKIDGMTSISYNINKENTNVILGKKTVCIWGRPYIEDTIHLLSYPDFTPQGTGITYQISPQSFYQVNPKQTEKLYSTALAFAGLTGNENVWDLYCGIGTISLFLSQKAKQVYGVEIVPQAIEDAKNNAKLNGITNAQFFVGKAEEVLPQFYENAKKTEKITDDTASTGRTDMLRPDVIVVDPPRKGCDEKCLDTMLAMSPERIVYVSCDSATLARDLKILCEEKYELIKWQTFDQFSHTTHVETVVLLSHKKADSYIHIDVEFGEGEGKIPVDSIAKRAEAYKPKEKVTYKMIKEYIEAKYGFKVHTAYIAEVKRNLGLPMYDAPNAVEELKQPKKHPTPEKVEAIKDALRYFAVI